MDIDAKYSPAQVEDKWYSYWLENRCFHSEPDNREPYTVVIPPPNVTGILHMGHVLNNTLNDVLVRKARMDGKNACWIPGTDHASIATESKVVARLKEKGISKDDLTREEFLKYAWEWKEEHGGIILQQLRKLGASCDWDRTRFTMEPELTDAVTATFCYFYKKGMIYRGVRMVNWDPVALTAISDDEVVHKDTKSHFYYLKYYISDGEGRPTADYVTIATTRPETIMADAAVCINPADERYRHLRGKNEEAGNLIKVEEYISPVGYSERTDAVIEPKLSAQWFLKMDELAAKALESVESGKIRLIPDKYRNTYRHWMENAHDWCISRQLWWGQRIPAYYLPDGSVVVEETPELALEAARKKDPSLTMADLRQDEDVLDTWFSSWLWPISVFDPGKPGHPDHKPNRDLSYYYPTNDLVTGPDIIFFWVARMIMAGDEFMEDVPFRNVYFTGIVRDKLGRKMSKTLGNSPDPLDLIAKYGADAVRLGMLLCSSAGNDILYDESQVEQGRNFCGKIWNSWRLVNGWNVDEKAAQPEVARIAVKWFDNQLSRTIEAVEDHYSKFRISDALMAVYKLFWDDYCSWYLELVKPAYGAAVDGITYSATLTFFEKLLKLIHPVMPFITEELWQAMERRRPGETIMFQRTPVAGPYDAAFLDSFDAARETVMSIRGIRAQKQISPKEALKLYIDGDFSEELLPVLVKFANISEFGKGGAEGASVSFIVGTVKMSIPLEGHIDAGEEKAKLTAELEHQRKFLASVRAKLGNEKFVSHAPEAVIAAERKKESDSLARIEALEASLKALE